MIKVFVITEEGRGGGPLKRMLLIAKALQEEIESVIILPERATNLIEKLDRNNIQFRKLNLHPLTRSTTGALLYLLYFIPELFQLWNLFKKEQPDLIHVNGSWQIKGILAGKLAGKRIVWHMNDTYQPKPILWLFRMLYSIPDGYIFASSKTQSYYKSIVQNDSWKKMSAVIPAPVDTETITFVKRESGNPIKLLTIGYINPHKGIEILLRAASLLKDENVAIDIVGPVLSSQANYKSTLDGLIESLAISNVSFLGYQTIDERFLKGYDFYVCSSLREASPMAVWEAMASGLPIVSTPVGDLPQLSEKFDFGKCTSSFSASDLSDVIKEMICVRPGVYKRMSLSARGVATKFFSVENVAKEYIRFYSSILREPTD